MKDSDYRSEEKPKSADAPKASGGSSGSAPSISGNHIYFYSTVSDDTVLDLSKKIQEWNMTMRKDLIDRELEDAVPSLMLHINSGGGSLFAGLSIMDVISSSRYPITTIVEGRAASAATLMSLSGRTRHMRKNSYMMIHQVSSVYWGKYEDLKDEMTSMEKYHKTIMDFYTDRTKIPRDKLEEILKRDVYFDSGECLEFGLVDKII